MTVDLTTGIVRILKPDGSTAGTGFVVSDEGFIATCAHVAELVGAGPGDAVRIVFHVSGQEAAATVEPQGWRLPDVEDTAFLQLSGSLPPNVIPAVLGASAGRSGAQIQAFGYPDLGQVEGLWGIGELIGPVTEARCPLLQLRSSEITAGFSGGPVWDVATGHVIGMVTQVASPDRYGRLGEVAFAIPSETLAALASLPLVEADLLTEMRTSYLASLRQRFEYLDLGGIAPRVQNRTVKLRMADVFVPLQARPEVEARLDLPDFMTDFEHEEDAELAFRILARGEREASARPMDLPELLGKPRAVILGDPGSGKSTLLRHVVFAIASGDGKAVGETALTRLPIFVRIIHYSQARATDPSLGLDRYVRGVSAGKWAPLVQAVMDAGEALLLLDGLDEVIDAHQRQGIIEAIHALAADYPGNQLLVTSRIVGYQAARLTGDFVHYTVQPLPPQRIAEFVEKWYAAIEREAGGAELSEEVSERAEELGKTIETRPGIRRLAENPLLLTIIALVNWRGRKLPNRRVELYAHAAETLIESWPYRRAGVRLETERVIRLLSPVAYRIFAARSAGDITEDDLLPVLADAIRRVDGVDRRDAERYAREFLSQVSAHSGIFREQSYDDRGRHVFGFLHLTFAEYFTARHLAGLWEEMGEDAEKRRALLRKYAHLPRWREVVLLMAGDIGMRDTDRFVRATRLLSDLLTLNCDFEKQLHRDLLLAADCLADDLRVQLPAARYVLHKLLELMPEMGIRETIRTTFSALSKTAHRSILIEGLLTHLDNGDEWVQYRMARVLGKIGHERGLDKLLALLVGDNERIRARVAWVLGDIGDPQAIELLRTRLYDENWYVRANAAWALGELGDVQSVNLILTQLDDGNWFVRMRTEEALRKLGRPIEPALKPDQSDRISLTVDRGTPEEVDTSDREWTAESLVQQLKSEKRDVQARATWALESFDRSQALELLLPLLEDQDESVRWHAAEALARTGDTRALQALLLRLEDESEWVRWAATWAVGSFGDPKTVEPLITRLKDKSAWVRWNAAVALRKVRDPRSVEPLVWCLKDEDEWVRRKATEALMECGDTQAIEPLVACLDDEDVEVRARISEALIAILNRSAPEPEPETALCEPEAFPGPWDE